MTKKQFIALADHIKEQRRYVNRPTYTHDTACSLTDFCASQNPQFNRERWLGYIYDECGPNGGTKGKSVDER